MTQEDKQLLLKDLCARLPYGVKAQYFDAEFGRYEIDTIDGIDLTSNPEILISQYGLKVDAVKPYFRPLSNMTEEEKIELKEYLDAEEVDCNGFGYIEGGTLEDYISRTPYSLCNYVIDWFNAHYFDYRGLIEMGLALEAPEGMYNIK